MEILTQTGVLNHVTDFTLKLPQFEVQLYFLDTFIPELGLQSINLSVEITPEFITVLFNLFSHRSHQLTVKALVSEKRITGAKETCVNGLLSEIVKFPLVLAQSSAHVI